MIEISWIFNPGEDNKKILHFKYSLFNNDVPWCEQLKRYLDMRFPRISEVSTQTSHKNVLYIQDEFTRMLFLLDIIQGTSYFDVDNFLKNYFIFFYFQGMKQFYNIIGKPKNFKFSEQKNFEKKLLDELVLDISNKIKHF